MSHVGHLRKFEAGLRRLAQRGHAVHVAASRSKPPTPPMAVIGRLTSQYPAVRGTLDAPEQSVRWPYPFLAWLCRAVALRALHERILEVERQRPLRMSHRDVSAEVHIARQMLLRWPFRAMPVRRFIRGLVESVERATPPARAVVDYVQADRPDVVVVSPLLHAPFLIDYVRAAARLRIPTALAVASWDNLTTKGPLLAFPDALIVWNEAQRLEAWREHRFPPINVHVTGAHAFDDWFHTQPRARTDWCRSVGLDDTAPYLLYLCSSPSVGGDETAFVERWIDALRSADDTRIRDLQVLVRPHPQNGAIWRDWRPARPGVVISPRHGEDPVEQQSKADYFDAMFHAFAVVGLNTTALIEAGIVGRPVLTVLSPDHGQERTPHFHHLVDGGLLRTARTFAEHHAQLLDVIETRGATTSAHRGFLTSFVRPYGLEWDSGPLFAAAVEQVAADGCIRRHRPWRDIPIAPVAWLTAAVTWLFVRPWWVWLDRSRARRGLAPPVTPPA